MGTAEIDQPARASVRAVPRRFRHLRYLVGDVWWTARVNRMWWLLPALIVVLLALAAAGTAQTAVPYAVYTLL
ncbi:hypothetical protein ACE2AJ_02215 [Aquihabitans daechungensis]|uniref:hypothetical protein n=1 Tax=Aquihabitans daechungensis TaxID=1052257 RepID=UPI003BA160DA